MTLHRIIYGGLQVKPAPVDHPVPPAKGGGRLGPCIDPDHPLLGLSKAQEAAKKKREKEESVGRLPFPE
jgi:hypothetical protein